ncbi:hypothetical protein BCR42DRAFT_440712 [Absidia repens]|uniref:DDT domain-containing protein n=1 Tax=Absidia repens TaxID=90262 RepID=A0A1X2I7Q0_9FUNG|nr:hypothetical protein BCR42DRAFT_440712 [Absidia repens]
MPSRHSRKAKSTINSYDEKKAQQTVTKSRKHPSTPTINVTDASPPELILHSSWKVLYIFQFLTMFRHYLNLPSITIDDLESMLLFRPNENNESLLSTQQSDQTDDNYTSSQNNAPSSRESSVVDSIGSENGRQQYQSLAKLLVPLLVSLYNDNKRKTITDSNYPEYIYKYMFHHSVEEDVQEILGRYPDKIDFATLSLLDKICILKELVDNVFETGTALQWKNNLQPEEMRAYSIGKDTAGWSYYVVGDSRLYREIAFSPRKRKQTTHLNSSSKALERSLAQELSEHGAVVIQKFESRKAAKLREEAKLERAKKFDMLPKKRSRRIEVKSEEDDRRRQLEELERAQWEYEELKREQDRKEQEELAEKEKQKMNVEDARLKEQVYQLLDHIVAEHRHVKRLSKEQSTIGGETNSEDQDDDSIAQLKYLRTKLKKSATYDETIEKLTGWATLLGDDYKVFTNMEEPILIVDQGNNGNQGQNQEPLDTEMKVETEAHSSDTGIHIMQPPTNGYTDTSSQSAHGIPTLSNIAPTFSPQQQHIEGSNDAMAQSIEQSVNRNSNNNHQSSMTCQFVEQQTPLSFAAEKQNSINEPLHSSAVFDVPPETPRESAPTDTPTHEHATLALPQTSNTVESTPSSNVIATNNSANVPPVAKRGRPRKSKKPVVDTTALLPSFSEALQFTGNGTKSDLGDPLLKLILSTIISQIRQHPIVTALEQRSEKKTGKKRKAPTAPTATTTFYTIHKKLLLNEYRTVDGDENGTGATDGNLATTPTDEGLEITTSIEPKDGTTTTEGTSTDTAEANQLITEDVRNHTSTNRSSDGLSAFDNWLKDMDLVLKPNDASNLELKNFTYNMFRLVFTNKD